MSKPNKEHVWRMEGMKSALDIVKKGGVEALEKDLKMRGFLRVPLSISQKEMDQFIEYITRNVYSTTMSVWFMTLITEFGFGKKRLHRAKATFDKLTMDTTDFDYLGNHYTSLGDYAAYLNETYNCGIDVERVEMCQSYSSTDQELKHMANVNEIIKVLKENDFADAAEFIESKI